MSPRRGRAAWSPWPAAWPTSRPAAAAFPAGSLTEDRVGVVCAHAGAAHDAEATAVARRCTVGQLRRIVAGIVAPHPAPDPVPDRPPLAGEDGDPEPAPFSGDVPGRRETAFGNADDGRWWARILLPPDEGGLVQRPWRPRDARFRAERGGRDDDGGRPAVGWSDALLHLAEAALSNIEGTGRLPADRFQVVFHSHRGVAATHRQGLTAARTAAFQQMG